VLILLELIAVDEIGLQRWGVVGFTTCVDLGRSSFGLLSWGGFRRWGWFRLLLRCAIGLGCCC